MKTDPKDPHIRIQLLEAKILRQRSALKSQRITILELQARLRKQDVEVQHVNIDASNLVRKPSPSFLAELLDKNEISQRTYNTFHRTLNLRDMKLMSVEDMAEHTQDDFMRLSCFGLVSLREVAFVLKDRGFWFKPGGKQQYLRDDCTSNRVSHA